MIAAVVLAAGFGRRLRPLTEVLPKALCPVGNVPLLDRALYRLAALGFAGRDTLAVNACYLAEQVVAHVGERAHLSVEPDEPLGTAGALGNLRSWIDGRAVLVVNADGYLSDVDRPPGEDVSALLDGWDATTVRMLTVPGTPDEFGGGRFAGMSLLPWSDIEGLPAEHAELVRTTWRPAERAGRLETVTFRGTYFDSGTPADYLAANLHAAGAGSLVDPTARVTGRVAHSVVGAGAEVNGDLADSVVWPGSRVADGERLTTAIRAGTADAPVTVSATDAPH